MLRMECNVVNLVKKEEGKKEKREGKRKEREERKEIEKRERGTDSVYVLCLPSTSDDRSMTFKSKIIPCPDK